MTLESVLESALLIMTALVFLPTVVLLELRHKYFSVKDLLDVQMEILNSPLSQKMKVLGWNKGIDMILNLEKH